MPKLVITDGEGTREVGLKSGDTLGRTSQNAIPLKVAEASRTHCRFLQEKGAWFIEDQGSSNGTLVNGRRVTKFELQDGDVIQIGKAELRFLDAPLEEAAPAASPSSWGADDLSLEDKVFLILGGARRGERIDLPEGRISVGRNMKHALVIKDASVSGDHAEIRREGTTCTIKDLGSSNGTFVNGRRVEEAELASGDVVRFGAIDCTFGIGSPEDFEPPVPSAVSSESSDQFTKVMEVAAVGGDLDTASFDLHAAPPPKKDTLWNIVSLVAILGLGGCVAWLVMRGGNADAAAGTSRSLERGANLLPEWSWSFEVPEGEQAAATWSKENIEDEAVMSESADSRRSGHFGYRIARADAKARPAFAILDHSVLATPGAAYELSAWTSGDGALPVLAAVWYEERREGDAPVLVEVGRDLVVGKAAGANWEKVEGIVFVPEDAKYVRVAVGAAGQGEVAFDDVSLLPAEAPAGRMREVAGYKAVLEQHGTLRLSHFGHRLLESLGVTAQADGRWIPQEELLVVDSANPAAGAVSGTLRGNRGDLRVELAQAEGEEGLRLRLVGPGLAGAGTLAFTLVPPETGETQVTVLDGEAAKSFSRAFSGERGSALIVGTGADRAKIHFRDPQGQPVVSAVAWETGADGNVVRVEAQGRPELVLELQLSFAAEQKEARELLAQANQAARDRRSGEALKACDVIMARFPFEAKIVEDAQRLQAQILADARSRLELLRKRIDDAVFFRDLARESGLVQEVAAEKTRFAGTAVGEEFAKLDENLQGEVRAWEAPRREFAATRLLERGQDFLDGGKGSLAELFFRTILQAHAGSDEAEQARVLMERAQTLKAMGAKEK